LHYCFMLRHIAVPTMPSFTDEKSLSTTPVINFSLQGSSLPILDSLNLNMQQLRIVRTFVPSELCCACLLDAMFLGY
jgi:hypothetical protein